MDLKGRFMALKRYSRCRYKMPRPLRLYVAVELDHTIVVVVGYNHAVLLIERRLIIKSGMQSAKAQRSLDAGTKPTLTRGLTKKLLVEIPVRHAQSARYRQNRLRLHAVCVLRVGAGTVGRNPAANSDYISLSSQVGVGGEAKSAGRCRSTFARAFIYILSGCTAPKLI